MNKIKTYPEGYFVSRWMGIGMIIFAGLGVLLSVITSNDGLVGIGPALGMSIGLAIGAAVEEKYKQKGLIVPDSRKGSNKRRIAIAISVIGVAIVVAVLFAV